MPLRTPLKPSEKLKARNVAVAQRKAARWQRAATIFLQGAALVGVFASVIAAVQPFKDLATTAPTAQILAPRSTGAKIEPQKMILLDDRFDQRFFYFVDKRQVRIDQPFLVGFPFSIRISGDKRLDKATITFALEHTTDGLHGTGPSLSDPNWPLLPDLPFEVVDLTGRNDPQRKVAMTPHVASVTFSGFEVLPNNEHFFQFYFAPNLYPVSVIEGGAEVRIAAYDARVTVVADGFNQTQRFRIVVLPGDDDDDFAVGIAAFSRFFSCKSLCNANWLRQQVHKVPWLATRLTQEYENVIVKPSPLYAQAPNGVFRVLKPEADTQVHRFVQIWGGSTQP